MRLFGTCAFVGVLVFTASPALASVITVSPADGTTGYTKIEGAQPGDEVVIAPGTYTYRVYLTQTATAQQPIYIHAQDPTNPPVWDFGSTLVENAPGSYTAPDKNRGCWQVSGASNIVIEGIVFKDCRAADYDSAGLRYYGGTTGLVLRDCVFEDNDNGLTGGTEASEATVEFCEFASNGNTSASTSSPTHNVYIYGGTFTMRFSYLHDPTQGQDLHCRAVTSLIEYNWFDRAKSYVGDLMTSDDYANNPTGSDAQSMTLLGNVIIESPNQANGSPVSFTVTALYNTVIGAGAHANFLHVSNADGTQMAVQASNNIIYGTSEPFLIEDTTKGSVTGKNNWVQTGASMTALTLSGTIQGTSPGFNDAANDDFTLASGSACIGAAAAVTPLAVDEYYENETVTREYRVRATANDLGAFEHDTTGAGMAPGDGGVVVGGGQEGGAGTTSGVSSSGSGGSSTGGSSGTTGGGTGAADASATDAGMGAATGKSGCGCTAAGAGGSGWSAVTGLSATLLLALRQRARRRRTKSSPLTSRSS
jgi:hypothetical protein